jgi:hypothetical protein
MAIITNIKDLESLHLEPVSNEDMKVILESLRTNKKLYINNKNLKVTTKYRNHKDEEGIANIVEDLNCGEFHSKSKREFVYKVGNIIDFKNVDNKHKIWEITKLYSWTYKRVNAGEIVIFRNYSKKEYCLAIGKSNSCFTYGLCLFKINNIQKAKELIHRNQLLKITTDETIELIKELSKEAV